MIEPSLKALSSWLANSHGPTDACRNQLQLPNIASRPPSKQNIAYILMGLVLLASLALRLIPIAFHPIAEHEDSSYHFTRAAQISQLLIANNSEIAESNGILYYQAVLPPVVWLFGDSAWAIRLPSVIFGGLSMWLIFLIAKRMGGIRCRLFALLLYGCNSLAIIYDSFARFHALDSMLCLLASYLLLLIIEGYHSPNCQIERKSYPAAWLWTAYLLSCTALSLSMVLSLFILPAHWLTLVICLRNKPKALAIAGLLAIMAIDIGFGLCLRDTKALSRTSEVYPLCTVGEIVDDTGSALNTLWQHSDTIPSFSFSPSLDQLSRCYCILTQLQIVTTAIYWLIPPLAACLLSGKRTRLRIPGPDQIQPSQQLVAWWALIPLLLMTAFSALVCPVISARNCLFIVPGWCLLLGSWLASHPKAVVTIWLCLTLILVPVTTFSVYSTEVMTCEPQLAAISTISSRTKFVIVPKYSCDSLVWTKQHLAQQKITPVSLEDFEDYQTTMLGNSRDTEVVWAVGSKQEIDQTTAHLGRLGYLRSQTMCFPSLSELQYAVMMTKVPI